MRKLLVGFAIIILVCMLITPVGDTPLVSAYTNMLYNPGFEGAFLEWETSVNVAEGWTPFWDTEPPSQKPEFSESDLDPHWYRVHSGNKATKIFSQWRTTRGAGIWQNVAGTIEGNVLIASVWVHAWSGYWCPGADGFWLDPPANTWPASLFSDPKDPNPDNRCIQGVLDPNNITVQIGIGAGGGTNPWSPNITWSQEYHIYDHYQKISVSAISRANHATVYLRYKAMYGFKINDVYFDDVSLVQYSPSTPTPTPTATSTPQFSYLPVICHNAGIASTPTPILVTPTPTNPVYAASVWFVPASIIPSRTITTAIMLEMSSRMNNAMIFDAFYKVTGNLEIVKAVPGNFFDIRDTTIIQWGNGELNIQIEGYSTKRYGAVVWVVVRGFGTIEPLSDYSMFLGMEGGGGINPITKSFVAQ